MLGVLNKIYLYYLNYNIKKYIFKIANEKERIASFQLRYQVFCEELNYLPKDHYYNNQEEDKYDTNAIIFVALNKNNEIVGTIRLIIKGTKLPTENYFNLEKYLLKGKSVAEISRFIVKKQYRNRTVSLGLIKIAIKYALIHHISGFVITCPVTHSFRYRNFGFNQIGEPYNYCGVKNKELSVTMYNDIFKNREGLKYSNPVFYSFLKLEHDSILL